VLQGRFHWLGCLIFSFKNHTFACQNQVLWFLGMTNQQSTYPDLTHRFFLWKTENRWRLGVNYMFKKIPTKTLKNPIPLKKMAFFFFFFLFFLLHIWQLMFYIFNDRVSQGQLSDHYCATSMPIQISREKGQCRSVELSSGSSTIES
jgi:hypothetical protein